MADYSTFLRDLMGGKQGARPPLASASNAPVVPQATAPSRNQQAATMARVNPNTPIPAEFSTGSQALDGELTRRAREGAALDGARSAVDELKRQQWLTGARNLMDEEAGAVAPAYAGDWAPQGPQQNGVFTAPNGQRFAMKDGVPVGASGTVGETATNAAQYPSLAMDTRDSNLKAYRNLLNQALGPPTEAPPPPAPAPTPAPTVTQSAPPAPVGMPNPGTTTPIQNFTGPTTQVATPPRQLGQILRSQLTPDANPQTVLAQAVEGGALPPERVTQIQAALGGVKTELDSALRGEGAVQRELSNNISRVNEVLRSGLITYGTSREPLTRQLNDRDRGALAEELAVLEERQRESKAKGDKIAAEGRKRSNAKLRELLSKYLPQ